MYNFYSKDLFVLTYYLIFLSICGFLLFQLLKANDKNKKKKKAIILVSIYVICNMLPIYYLINLIPIEHKSIEEAFSFDNGFFKYKIIYEEKIDNKIYLIGKSVNPNDNVLRFYCYEKNKNEYRLVNKNSDRSSNFKILEKKYIADYIKDGKKTAVFLSDESVVKQLFSENTSVTDKYGTKFKYVVDKKNKPITYGESKNYIYFGIVEKPINNDYYILINNEKIRWN